MTKIGTVIAGRYEILKEIGHGGMSTVYLANDTHMNRNWAVKEVAKEGLGQNDKAVSNSPVAEAHLLKRLDHPFLPRITDIIDNDTTFYIIMDFIEGESLDKVLKEYGAQPEERVIEWAMQICDVLSYLHNQKPPIIYRDMKPENLMLKPNGNICIIDFGIAREYKEQNLSDTIALGTPGYAAPEQYNGQTDQRSDIYALGMTMCHLLTGVYPARGDGYMPVRQYNPALSEGIEAIINKCVEPAAEKRYQSCAELLVDLQSPDKVTWGWRRQLKRRIRIFGAAAGLAVLLGAAGLVLHFSAVHLNNEDYDSKINTSDPAGYYEAVEIYPGRTAAYEKLVAYYKTHDTENDAIDKLGNQVQRNAAALDPASPEVAALYYDIGKLYFAEYDGALKARAVNAKDFFKTAADTAAKFDKKEIAACYEAICKFMTSQSTTEEHTLADYTALFQEIDDAMAVVEKASDSEANYDKISLYYVTILLLQDQSRYMAGVGFEESTALQSMERAYEKSMALTSTLPYVTQLQDKLRNAYPDFVAAVQSNYNEVAKRQNGGGGNG